MCKWVMRCGICDVNFKTEKEFQKHFDSKKHKENVNNPGLMAKKVFESQQFHAPYIPLISSDKMKVCKTCNWFNTDLNLDGYIPYFTMNLRDEVARRLKEGYGECGAVGRNPFTGEYSEKVPFLRVVTDGVWISHLFHETHGCNKWKDQVQKEVEDG